MVGARVGCVVGVGAGYVVGVAVGVGVGGVVGVGNGVEVGVMVRDGVRVTSIVGAGFILSMMLAQMLGPSRAINATTAKTMIPAKT